MPILDGGQSSVIVALVQAAGTGQGEHRNLQGTRIDSDRLKTRTEETSPGGDRELKWIPQGLTHQKAKAAWTKHEL